MDQRSLGSPEMADYCSHKGERPMSGGLGSEYEPINRRKVQIMSGRTLVSLSASAIVGIACVVTVATDAFAQRRGGATVARGGVHHAGVARAGVYRGGVARAGVYRRGVYGAPVARSVAVGLGAAAVGAAATGAYGAYGPSSSYYGYGNNWADYAARNGLVCQPGTLWTGPDGLQHLCQ